MRDFQEKKKLARFLYSKVTLLLLVLAIGFMVKANWDMYKKVEESQKNAARARSELETITARKNVLTHNVTRFQTEAGIEERIRSKFSVSMPGEKIVVIVGTSSAAAVEQVRETWWDKFKQLFK
jgi:cell division protein FtsB